jgi:hypothetical protein
VFNGNVWLSGGELGIDTMNFNGTTGLTGYDIPVGRGGVTTIYGIVNIESDAVWNVAATSTLTCDLAGTLNLGGDAANLTVLVTHAAGTVTFGGATCYRFTLNTDATFAGGGFTLALNEGVYTSTKGTVTGILDVVLGSGGITYTAGTYSGATFSVTVPLGITTTVFNWVPAGSTSAIDVLTIAGTATQNGHIACNKYVNTGAHKMATYRVYVYPDEDDPISCTGTIEATNATAYWSIALLASVSNAGPIKTPYGCNIYDGLNNPYTLTANGGVTVGTTLLIYNDNNLMVTALVLGAGSSLSATTVQLGSGTYSGTLTLGAATHTIGSGGLAKSGAGTINAFTAQAGAVVNFAGDITLTGIAADLTSSAWFATATGKTITGGAVVTAAGCDIFANGKGLVVKNMTAAPAGSIRVWNAVDDVTNGGGNGVACVFHPGTPDDV